MKIERTFYFTDSQINLCRLKKSYSFYKQCVMKQITFLTKVNSWLFVPLASTSKTGWRMSASLTSPSKPGWRMSASLASTCQAS
jgi:hypothetical protein